MRALIAAAALFAATPGLAEEAKDYDALIAEANAAYREGDWRTMATALDAAQARLPYSLHITRFRILAYAELGEYDEAIAIARDVADRGLSLPLEGHDGFDALKKQTAFDPLTDKMADNLKPKGEANIILETSDDGLLPESVALADGRIFIGAVRQGGVYDGDRLRAETVGGVYGVRFIDDLIWTVENTRPPHANPREGGDVSGFYAYERASGRKHCAIELEEEAVLGAIESTPIGLVASDSLTPRLFVAEGCGAKPRLLSDDPRFANLQGLAYDAARGRLFLADYLAGLFAVDIPTGAVTPLANSADAHLGGIDGLALYKGDLIGVQNGTSPQRIVRLRLNEAGDAVERLEVLQQALPAWNEPTNGVIADGAFLYVATSNWPAYTADGQEVDGAERKPLRVMSVTLD